MYKSAYEYNHGISENRNVLKKLENLFKGYEEVNLNLLDFISHNNLDMILNNDLISNEYAYFEMYNYDELYFDELDEITQQVKKEYLEILSGLFDKNKYYFIVNDLEYDPTNIKNTPLDEILEDVEDYVHESMYDYEVYQYFIIPEYDATHYWSKYTSYPIFYSEELDIFLLGITHWGMSWEYFETSYKVRQYL